MSISVALMIDKKYRFIFHSGRDMIGFLTGFSGQTLEFNLGHDSENIIVYKEDLAQLIEVEKQG
jgi:hypothetical protein